MASLKCKLACEAERRPIFHRSFGSNCFLFRRVSSGNEIGQQRGSERDQTIPHTWGRGCKRSEDGFRNRRYRGNSWLYGSDDHAVFAKAAEYRR